MSRRVFDVGLDIGRIKNGIHRRQEAKRSKSGRSVSVTEPASAHEGNQVAVVPRIPRKKSDSYIGDNERVLSPPSSTGPATLAEDFPLPPSSPQDHHASPEPGCPSPESHKEGQNFDLNPPPPRKPVKLLDFLSERLFSEDHLRVILRDPQFFMRFTAFLNRYKPQYSPILVRYLEAQKAIKAVEYANALAESLKPIPDDESSKIPCAAATIDARFESRSRRSWETLVNEALPAYITFGLVKIVTESMVREITGTTMPLMRELVGGLAEVFCLADPSQQDTPIVYASEEFYRTTQYGRDYVIGKNCRFLQGPKTNKRTITRLGTLIKGGQEASETILNYRRGGEPFMNLLMTAPLYDNRGKVRYIIGAQVDVSGLVEEGRGLDSFERTLNGRPNTQRDSVESDQKHLRRLGEFGEMLSQDESSALGQGTHSRTSSVHETESAKGSIRGGYGGARSQREPGRRRMLGNEDEETEIGREWALSSSGPSGKLPGVYQNYFLVRPFPSLRIIFVSPALRIPGLLQTHFLARIGGPSHVREGLSEAFESGESVTAKVTWLPQGRSGDGDYSRPGSSSGARGAEVGKTRYISCTPLLGSDDQVGVWMVVMVENERVTGTLPSRQRPQGERLGAERASEIPNTPSEFEREEDSTRNFVSAADGRRNDRPQGEVALNGNGTSSRYDYASNTPRSPPSQLHGEAGRAYTELMHGQQRTNGNTHQTQTRSPYGHRIHEDYSYQAQQRPQTQERQPMGPGKVVGLDSEGEDDEMMGRGGGNGMEAFMDGSGSPRIRGGGARERWL